MNSHKLSAENILESLPQPLKKDPNMMALASSVAATLESRRDEIRLLAIYSRIDELPEELLDILAQDFKVDWWDPNYSLEKKRQTLKDSWSVHRMLGTRASVETALSAIYDDFEILEWWEYGGTPGCFKVSTGSFQIIDNNFSLFIAALKKVKRLSAHLEKVNVSTKLTGTVGVGIASQFHIVTESVMEVPAPHQTYLTDEDGAVLTDEKGVLLIM